MASSNYLNNEMKLMQENAIRRVSDMQKRANENLQKSREDNGIMPNYIPAPIFGDMNENRRGTMQNRSNKRIPASRVSAGNNNNRNNHKQAVEPDNIKNNGTPNQERTPYTEKSQMRYGASESPRRSNGKTNNENNKSENNNERVNNNILNIPDSIPDLLNGFSSPLQGVMKSLNLDTERLIIIALIILLLNEGADRKVILALAYILF